MGGLEELLGQVSILPLVLFTAIGVVVGLIVSGLPGLSGVLAVIVLLPLTARMDLLTGLGMLIGAYKAVQFGGSIPATTLNMPGTPEAAAGTPDMYGLTRKGYPLQSLGISLHAGTIGDLVADVVVLLTLPLLASLALAFGTRELLAVAVLALFVLPSAVLGSALKSFVAIGLGLFFSMIGPDPITGFSRLSFGLPVLRGGLDVVPLVIGALAMSVVIEQLTAMLTGDRHGEVMTPVTSAPDDRVSWKLVWGAWRELSLGAGLGVFLGALPGPGATMAAYSSYGIASRWKRNRGTFGTGNPRGIVAAEVANNATVGPGFVPLLAFGIPGTAMAGILAGAFTLHGLTPGPGLFRQSPELLYGFVAVLVLATLLNWPLGRIFIHAYKIVPSIKTQILMPVIWVLLVVATFGYRNNMGDVYVMLAFGLIGFALIKTGYPVAPLVVAFLVGPILETQLRRALQAGGGDWLYLVSSPVALSIYAAMVLLIVVLSLVKRRRRSGLPDDDSVALKATFEVE